MKSILNKKDKNKKDLDSITYIESNIENKLKKLYHKTNELKIRRVFGTKEDMLSTCSYHIDEDKHNEYKNDFRHNRKFSSIYIKGDKSNGANRFLKIVNENGDDLENIDIKYFCFCPNKYTSIKILISDECGYKDFLKELYKIQENKLMSITYRLCETSISIVIDDIELCSKTNKNGFKKNRIMSVDLNPDYIGYTISDWSSSRDYRLIKKGVVSFKKINDYEKELNGKDIKSDDEKRKYITNKRHHEIHNAVIKLVMTAKYYNCQLFGIENLDFEDDDKTKEFNFLTKKMWCRELTITSIIMHCNYNNITVVKVKPEYSSLIGNILFRHLNMPDMCLSAFEIGRRVYEYYNQYTTKENTRRKNIIFPERDDFTLFYSKSMEEFNCKGKVNTVQELIEHVKNSKSNQSVTLTAQRMYRVPLSNFYNSKLCSKRIVSKKSMVEWIDIL